MISDRVNGAAKDLAITPVRPSAVALGYFISTVLSTLAICMTALGASFIYLSHMGWYLSASDVLLLILDVILLVLFGTAYGNLTATQASSMLYVQVLGQVAGGFCWVQVTRRWGNTALMMISHAIPVTVALIGVGVHFRRARDGCQLRNPHRHHGVPLRHEHLRLARLCPSRD